MALVPWIKMRGDLADDPAVVGISRALNIDPDLVVGKLLRFWSWAEANTKDGNACNVDLVWIDRHVRLPGFAKAMADERWLVLKSDGIEIPNYGRHMGQLAKTRQLTAERVARHRASKRDDDVTLVTPLEERRGDRVGLGNTRPPIPEARAITPPMGGAGGNLFRVKRVGAGGKKDPGADDAFDRVELRTSAPERVGKKVPSAADVLDRVEHLTNADPELAREFPGALVAQLCLFVGMSQACALRAQSRDDLTPAGFAREWENVLGDTTRTDKVATIAIRLRLAIPKVKVKGKP
jgi:hypothetical protein